MLFVVQVQEMRDDALQSDAAEQDSIARFLVVCFVLALMWRVAKS